MSGQVPAVVGQAAIATAPDRSQLVPVLIADAGE